MDTTKEIFQQEFERLHIALKGCQITDFSLIWDDPHAKKPCRVTCHKKYSRKVDVWLRIGRFNMFLITELMGNSNGKLIAARGYLYRDYESGREYIDIIATLDRKRINFRCEHWDAGLGGLKNFMLRCLTLPPTLPEQSKKKLN